MRGNIDMANINEGGTYAPIPQGIYAVEIVECIDKTSANGDPMASVKFLISEGEQEGNWVWDNIILSDNPESPGYKILGKAKHFLHIIGEYFEGKITYDTDNWIGKKLKVELYHDEYKGKVRAKVNEHMFLVEPDTGSPHSDNVPF